MKSHYWLIVILFSFGCQSKQTAHEKKENNLEDNLPVKLTNRDIHSEEGNEYQNVDTTLNLVIKKDTAYFTKGPKLIVQTYIQPRRILKGPKENPQEIVDKAFILSSNLIILRGVLTAGHFCHIPEVKRIDIYDSNGNYKSIKNGNKKSKALLGFDFTSNFLGNNYSSPDGSWGIITIEAEGDLLGFLYVNKHGEIKELTFENDLAMQGSSYNANFRNNHQLIFDDMKRNDSIVKLIINSSGKINIVEQ